MASSAVCKSLTVDLMEWLRENSSGMREGRAAIQEAMTCWPGYFARNGLKTKEQPKAIVAKPVLELSTYPPEERAERALLIFDLWT